MMTNRGPSRTLTRALEKGAADSAEISRLQVEVVELQQKLKAAERVLERAMGRLTYRSGEICDAEGRQLLRLVASNATRAFRDKCGKTLVCILNSEEHGKSRSALSSKTGESDG